MILNKKERFILILFLILIFFYFLEGIFWVLFGNIWDDENWYFAKSYLVSKGKLPYIDFFDHHQPLSSLIYAIPQYLFGPSLFVGRLSSFLFAFLTILLACGIAAKLAGKKAALLVIVLNMVNPHLLYYSTVMAAHTIEVFLVILAVYLLTSNLKKPFNYILSVSFMSLANCVKNLASPWVWALLLFIIVKEKQNRKIIFYSFITAMTVMGLVLVSFILAAGERFLFGASWLLTGAYAHELRTKGLSMLDRILYLVTAIQNYFIIYLLLPAFLIYAWFIKDKRRKILSYLRQYDIIALIALIVMPWFFMPFLGPAERHPIYWNYYFPIVSLLLAVGIIKVFESLKDNTAKIFFNILIAVSILLTPLLQSDLWRLLNIKWQRRELLCIYKVAHLIDKYTQKDAKVFTFTPAFAAQADREPLPAMDSDMLPYHPSWDIERCKKFGQLNADILMDYLNKKEAGILVLTQDRFFQPRARAIYIKNDLSKIIKVINKNYYLKEKLSFPDIFRGDVYIYLRR